MSFPYPPKPWSDGDTASQLQTDGTIITGTYNSVDNVWNMVRSNPDANGGIDGYISDKQVLLAPTDIVSHGELEMRLEALTSDVTPHDLDLIRAGIDAKFDMLRSAIREAVDFDTFKVRLLAVLE